MARLNRERGEMPRVSDKARSDRDPIGGILKEKVAEQ